METEPGEGPTMADGLLGSLLGHVRALTAPDEEGLSDRQLLQRFARQHDEAAFNLLVQRHGAMVLGVCRRLLRDSHDAEDAFQATFLVLARRAGSIGWSDSVGSWLHAVACRVARKAQVTAARRKRREREAAMTRSTNPIPESDWHDLRQVLDQELGRLPEKYRAPLVLCYLEGRTNEEAARQLGWPLGTVQGRLARARDLLRRRLTRRGLALSATTLALESASELLGATPPAALLEPLGKIAVQFALGQTLSVAAVSGEVLALAEGVCRSLLLRKLALAAVVVLALCVPGLGAGLIARSWLGGRQAVEESAPPVADTPRSEPARRDPGAALPPGALVRFGALRFRHAAPVRRVALSPDGTLVASASDCLRVWDTASGKERYQRQPQTAIHAVSFSPDGRLLASAAADGTVRLWETQSGKEVQRFQGSIRSLCFSPKGDLLAGSDDKGIRLWQTGGASRGNEERTIVIRQGWINTFAFAPDGQALVSGGQDGMLRAWDVKDGQKLREWKAHRGQVTGVAFTPDGKTLASCSGYVGNESGTVQLWEWPTGKERARLKGLPEQHVWVDAVAISPDGKTVAACAAPSVWFWDTKTGAERPGLAGLEARADTLGSRILSLAFSTDGTILVTGGSDQTVRVWDLRIRAERRPAGGHGEAIDAVAFSPDGRQVATAGADQTVRLWDATSGREGRQFECGGAVGCLAYAPDGKTLATGGDAVRLWDVGTGREVRKLTTGVPRALAYSSDGRTLAVLSGAPDRLVLEMVDVAGGKESRRFTGTWRDLNCLAFSPDGKLLAVAGHQGRLDDYRIWLLDAATGKVSRELVGHFNIIRSVAFSPDGRLLASAGGQNFSGRRSDYSIRIWQTADGETLHRLEVPLSPVHGLAFSPDGRALVSAHHDKLLRLWEVATGQERCRFAGHLNAVNGVAFAPEGRRLLSGSADGTALVWNVLGPAGEGRVPGSAAEWDLVWEELLSDQAPRAYRGMGLLVRSPGPALALLGRRLHPQPVVEGQRLKRLLADLESEQFAVRDKARPELERLGDSAAQALSAALAAGPSLEVRLQVKRLLSRLEVLTPERLRLLRAVEVLEQIEDPAARRLLQKLAEGAPGARLTEAARAALERQARRRGTP
jgi:RNA polymerase sigma factor (sigma-70 family)